MNDKLLGKAKEIMGSQFNEQAWINQIDTDPKRAEELLNKISKKMK